MAKFLSRRFLNNLRIFDGWKLMVYHMLPHGYLINMETELQSEASTSSMCLNLTEDETSSSTSVFSALDRQKYPQPSELAHR